MDQSLFLEVNALPWVAMLILVLVGTLGAVVVAVQTMTGTRLHPLVSGLVLGVLAVIFAAGIRLVGFYNEASEALYVAAGIGLMAPVLLALPALVHAILVAFVGGWRKPRSFPMALGILALALGVAGTPALFGAIVGNGLFPFGLVRSLFYLVFAVLLFPAMLHGGGEERASAEAGASAGLAFATLVGICEACARAPAWFFLLPVLVSLEEPELRMEGVRYGLGFTLDPLTPLQWVTVSLAGVVGLLSLIALVRLRKRASLLLGAVWLAVGPATFVLGNVSLSDWEAFAREAPVVVADP
ncbi:MAG: hypothetical protein EA397_14495 [Deltaproteobacteria bacterium]|nr:MAG: hypothetical protein EA397_14495 [Deltaproteobacteria bacterium]